MNIEHAKTIPLSAILSKIGATLSRERKNNQYYLAPWRNEKTPSLHINTDKNLWFDHGENIGGDSISLVCRHLKSCEENNSPADALRWLKNMMGYVPTIPSALTPNFTEEDGALVIRKISGLTNPALIRYLESRGVPLSVGKKLLKEVRVFNKESGNVFFALGLKNEDGGYELRNPLVKACVKPKTITFIRGKMAKPDGVHIFEGFMDYLSIITRRKGKKFSDDTIILNSLSCMKDASAYIKNYGYRVAYTWLDNDEAGDKATKAFAEFFSNEEALEHRPLNSMYAPHKDVNAWHMDSRLD